MVTKSQIISDIELQLYGGTISDDAAIEKSQIAFWASNFLNQFVANECNEHLKRGQYIPSVYQTQATIEVPILEELEDIDEDDERIYIELDEEVLTLNKDGGVLTLLDDQNNEFKKVDIQTLQMFKHTKFGKPSHDNILYYRQGNRIFLYGFKPVDIPFEAVQVWFVPKQNLLEMTDDQEVKVSDLVLPQVIAATVETGKLQLYGSQADKTNNAEDDSVPVYHQQIRRPE